MKVCVFGAGAVGGHLAARLASHAAGQTDGPEISVVARGAHLAAIREGGIRLRNNAGESWHARIAQATDKPESLPAQDVVLVALKAVSLPAQAEAIGRLLAPGGVAVFLNNGIPWWWNHGAQGLAGAGQPLPLLDPDAALWREVGPGRALGAVVYSPNEVEAPGAIFHRNREHNRFIVGTPRAAGEPQRQQLARVVELLRDAGLAAEASEDLCCEIWLKLLVNAAGNPVSALTCLSTGDRAADPELSQLSRGIAAEIAAIANALGWPIAASVVEAAAGVGKAQSLRPSMLQDVLLGRPMEVEALLGQPQRFAREAGVATPIIDVLLPLLRGRDRAGLVS